MDKVSISLLIGGAVSASLLNSTEKTGKALNGLNQNLQELKRAEQSARSLDGLQASLEQTRAKLKSSSKEASSLAVAMRKVERPSKEMVRAFEAAKRESSALKAEFRGQVTAISKLRSELKAANVDTKNLSASQKGLAANLKSVSAAQQRLVAAQAASAANRQALNNTYAQALETGAIAYSFARALGPAIKFESAMADVAKVVKFESTESLRAFGKELKSLSREIPLTATELADIAAAGGRFGLAADKLPDFVRIVSRISTAFDLLPGEAGEAIAKLSNIFNIPINDIERLGDAIDQLANNAATNEASIIDVLQRVGGTSQQFGLVAKETAALATAFLALGRTPQVASTAINALLNKLQTGEAQSDKFQAALESIGLSSQELANKIRRDPQKALLDFLETLKGLDNQARAVVLTNLFGQEYSDDISILVSGLEEYRRTLGLVANETEYAGGVQKQFDERIKNSDNQIKILINGLTEVAINIGTAVLPVLLKFSQAIQVVSQGIADLADKFPEISAVVGAAIAGFIAFKAAAIAARIALSLFKEPLLAVEKSMALFAARGQLVGKAATLIGTASTVAAGGVLKLRTAATALSAVLSPAGGLAAVAVAAATGVFMLRDAMNDAAAASRKVRENTEDYRNKLRATMSLYEYYAGVTVKSSEEIARLSDTERKAYEESLDKAEKYWSARNQLEQEGTGEANKQTLERLRGTRRGITELLSLLSSRERIYADNARKLAEAKRLETNAIRAEFEKQKKIYDEELSKLDQIGKAREAFSKKIADLQAPPPSAGDNLIKDTVLAPLRELQRGQAALDAGNFKEAETSANRVVEQLKALNDAGKISRTFLQQLTSKAGELGKNTFDALENQQKEKIESAKQKLIDLKSDFDFLQSIQVGFDTDGAIASVESLRAKLQALISETPLVFSVQTGASTDIPTLKDLEGKAAGGPILGPGPKGRDSILMYGAPGEHMITSSEVDAVGGHSMIYRLRAAMRSGLIRKLLSSGRIPGFANGGPIVPSLPSLSPPAFSSSPATSGAPMTFVLDGRQVTVDAIGDGVDQLYRMLRREQMKRGSRT